MQGNSKNTRNSDSTSQQTGKENQYKNVETSVNNKNYFDEDYSVKREGEISKEEAATEKEDRPDRSK